VLGVGEIARRLMSEMDLSFRVSGWVSPVQRRRNLQHFISLCDKFQESAAMAGKSATMYDFLIWLQSNKKDLKSAAAGDADAVNVLTMHKAKGLEWPIVIPVGKPKTLTNLDKIDELYQSCFCPAENGNDKYIRFAFNPFGKTYSFPGNASQHFSTDDLNALFNGNHEEHLRLMYVTTTRARDLMVDLKFKPSSKGPKYSGFSSLFLNIPETVSGNFPEFTAARPGMGTLAVAQSDQAFFTPGKVEAAVGRPYFIQPSKLDSPDAANALIETIKNFESRITIEEVKGEAWNGIKDRKDELLGTLLHAVFYLEDIQNLNSEDFQRMAGGLFSISEKNLKALKELHLAFFNWCRDFAGKDCLFHRELPLEYQENGQIWTGTADLVLEGKNGVFLIDYKSYQGGEGEITGNGEHSARRYYGQLSAYRKMLKANMEDNSGFREMLIFYPMSGLMVKLIDKL
jgi:ATP-dependent exoDNAse (exonuclease V) beta subunit